jgi:hypothetical protein
METKMKRKKGKLSRKREIRKKAEGCRTSDSSKAFFQGAAS